MNVSYVGKIIHSSSSDSAFYTTPLTAVIYKGKQDINSKAVAAKRVASINNNSTSIGTNSNGIMTSSSLNAVHVPSDEDWESGNGNSSSSGSSRDSNSDFTTEHNSSTSVENFKASVLGTREV